MGRRPVHVAVPATWNFWLSITSTAAEMLIGEK
jgi:hypothetical protein